MEGKFREEAKEKGEVQIQNGNSINKWTQGKNNIYL